MNAKIKVVMWLSRVRKIWIKHSHLHNPRNVLKNNICISVKAVDIQWTMFLHSTTEKKNEVDRQLANSNLHTKFVIKSLKIS